MPENQSGVSVQPTRNAVAAILGGIVVITLTFLTYRYFNQPEQPEITGGSTSESTTDVKKEAPTETKPTNTDKKVNGGVLSASTQQGSNTWLANDYKQGDVKEASYKVRSGDTLWELAEAKYGDGGQWVKIRDANKGSIGFLPNGSQALIEIGQILVLP
ncbi:MAG: LysM peptidoglycan-binding domain-containing protein [Patescibacteria group bacterium]